MAKFKYQVETRRRGKVAIAEEGPAKSFARSETPRNQPFIYADIWRGEARSKIRDVGQMLAWMPGASDRDGNPRCLDKAGKPSAEALPDIGCYECAIPMPSMLLLIR